MPKQTLPRPSRLQGNDFEQEVARRLKEAGARPAYIKRFVEELKDHRETDSAWPREEHHLPQSNSAPCPLGALGEVDFLVEAALEDPRVLQWARRWPAIIFGVLAALAIPVSFTATALLLIGAVEGLDRFFGIDVGTPDFSFFHSAAKLYIETARIILPPAIGIAFCALAQRAHLRRRWLALAAICMMTAAMATTFPFEISADGREASLSIDIEHEEMLSRGRNAIPVAAPYAILWMSSWLWKASRKREEATMSGAPDLL